MMSKNSSKIISILVKSGRFMTSQELAQIIGVSSKTIYRAVNEINQTYDFPIIKSERGKGYLLDYEKYLELSDGFHEKPHLMIQSPLERRNEIIIKLLFSAPLSVNIKDVYASYYVSTELIRQDLFTISELLKKYSLKLVHEGNYVVIKGEEENIRRAINNALIQSKAINMESISDLANEFEDLSSYDNQFLTTQIEWIQKSLNTTVPYPYNVNIFSHLYILIKRFRRGKTVQYKDKINIGNKYHHLKEHNSIFWKVSNDVIHNTADYVHREIPTAEIYYLLEYLISMRYNHDFAIDDKISADSKRLANYYIAGFNLDMNNPKTKALKSDLISHIRPMYNRLNNHIIIANKLLDDIKSEYRETFSKLKTLSSKAYSNKYLPWKISDDEIGFLTLYFAKYFEETNFTKKAIVMCASGIGTSKLLYTKIHRNFPDLDLIGTISKNEYEKNSTQYADLDLIISTIPVLPQNNEQVILSSAMFNAQDKNRLSRYLNENKVSETK